MEIRNIRVFAGTSGGRPWFAGDKEEEQESARNSKRKQRRAGCGSVEDGREVKSREKSVRGALTHASHQKLAFTDCAPPNSPTYYKSPLTFSPPRPQPAPSLSRFPFHLFRNDRAKKHCPSTSSHSPFISCPNPQFINLTTGYLDPIPSHPISTVAMAPKKADGAATKAKTSTHASYQDMITDAIIALKDRQGSSRQSLKKYVKANNTINAGDAMFDVQFNKALKSGVTKGVFEQPKGPSGGTKLSKKTKPAAKPAAKKEVKEGEEKPKKAAPKKTAAKKEPTEKKPAVKKAAAPKKAAPKKAAAKKDAPAVVDKPTTLTKTKSGRVAKTAAKPAAKKAAAPKKAAPKKEKAPKKEAKAEAAA
ncbi:hypothetical protein GGR57DRAFT_234410 [Xylariaceae sp. FL1272]|nr:hypothetical protein GGR57DRAFT_234410 [Xylariaceae sp. FL1272]